METHFATIWESIADVVPDHLAIVHGKRQISWREYDDRSARLAHVLLDAGLSSGSKVAMFMYNCPEYVETQFGALKIRAVPVNVNYRYLDDELLYLLDNADAEAIVFHTSLGDRVARIRDRLPDIKLFLQVDDGGQAIDGISHYGDLIATAEPADRMTRSNDDMYMFYTGGTTGMPKGVMYEIGQFTDRFIQQTAPTFGVDPVKDAAAIAPAVKTLVEEGKTMVAMCGPPLMHATGCWLGQMVPHLFGATVVLSTFKSLDADDLIDSVSDNGVNLLVIVGDAFARPILRRLEHRAGNRTMPDLSRLQLVVSSGAMWSTEVKEGLLSLLPHTALLDTLGSTEGSMAVSITTSDAPTETARFEAQPTTKIFDEHDNEITAGSGNVGMVATSGLVPTGYYKDPDRSALTFRTIGGVRWSFPGDWATVDADGTVNLLGRGSQCINSGGEKIFPEEVEEAVKTHDSVFDCLIFGVTDERFGERVAGVFSYEADVGSVAKANSDDTTAQDPTAKDAAQSVREHLQRRLSSYKLPKELVAVTAVPRLPNGKADYDRARELFEAERTSGAV